MEFVAATPEGYDAPGMEPLRDPREAAQGANVLCTDVWTSMGQVDDQERRVRDFAGYRIDGDLLALAAPHAIVLHCLPAHLGDEITADVLYGPQCAAWDEAENRLHSEKALLALVVE
jgi:ornithine carbamoyltransferase